MKRIAFVVVRYGENINGGAELHCRMLAERLIHKYQVEVLTTCVKNYSKKENELPEGTEWINGVLVRRFKINPSSFKSRYQQSIVRNIRGTRRLLYRLHLLPSLAKHLPVWPWGKEGEINTYKRSVFYSSSLFDYIARHKDDYDVFIPITIDYPEAYYTIKYAGAKSLLIPTMHYHKNAFRPILTEIFTKTAYIGFNTLAEQQLAENIFGSTMAPHGIISTSIEITPPADWKTTVAKYQLPEEYMLYVGRIDLGKLDRIFQYFTSYKKKYKDSKLKFVLAGGIFTKIYQHPDIIYTGFVSENEKTAIIQHAKFIINPSVYESLSLILLEALSLKKAMIANERCNVMKEHYQKSGKAILLYSGKQSFIHNLYLLDSSDELRKSMEEKGVSYVEKNYSWEVIMKRLTEQIEKICSHNPSL